MKLLTRGYWKIFVLTVFALMVPVSGILIVDCTENCTSDQVTIGDALENLTSNTILRFTPGVHVLQISSINHEFENVSLIGDGQLNTIISCVEGGGLAFVDVVGLTIENITVQQCGMSGESLSIVLNITNSQTTSFSHKVPHSPKVTLLSFLKTVEM